ncbi:hypothetical protein YC2023_094991 [Brassica napus]
MCRQNCCAKSSQEEEVISPPDENLLIYCEVVTDGEKSKAGKKRAKAPWAKPLSQYSQVGLAVCSSFFADKTQKYVVMYVSLWLSVVCKLRIEGLAVCNDAQSPKAYTTEDYLKITEEQLKASSPGKIQREDQIQTQERAVQSQPEG